LSFSNYYELYVLDLLLNKTLFVGLSTADPGEDGSGLAEPSGNAYARVTLPKSYWNDASGGSKDNGTVIEFTQATGSWGTITHVCLFDAITSGNLLLSGALDTPVAIVSGDIFRFPITTLAITLD
jgi:hypothetical protein